MGATSVALGALNHRHAAYQSPRATEVAPTVCRSASAKGTAINPALPLPFDKLISGRVNSSMHLSVTFELSEGENARKPGTDGFVLISGDPGCIEITMPRRPRRLGQQISRVSRDWMPRKCSRTICNFTRLGPLNTPTVAGA